MPVWLIAITGLERGCVADQPQHSPTSSVLRLVEDDTAAPLPSNLVNRPGAKTPCFGVRTIVRVRKRRVLERGRSSGCENAVFWNADDRPGAKTPCFGACQGAVVVQGERVERCLAVSRSFHWNGREAAQAVTNTSFEAPRAHPLVVLWIPAALRSKLRSGLGGMGHFSSRCKAVARAVSKIRFAQSIA